MSGLFYLLCLGTLVLSLAHLCEGLTSVRARQGQDASLTCTGTSPSTTTLVWDRHGATGALAIGGVIQAGRGRRYSITSAEGVETLTIRAVGVGDSDIYRCYPFTSQSQVNNINLTVLVRPEYLAVSLPPQPVEEGRSARVTCTAGSATPPANITWTLTKTSGDSHEVRGQVRDVWHANHTTTRVSEVFVPATRDLYGAVFTCTARQEELGFTETAQATLDMFVAPLPPVLLPPEPAAVEGERTFLTCTARDARPPATVAWYWEGSAVNGDVSTTTNGNGTSDVTNRLYVTPTERQNGIEFVCEVRHSALEVTGRAPYRVTHTLDVRYKPRVSVADQRVTAWEGSTFTVTCSFYANPNDTQVTWLKGDTTLAMDQRMSTSTEAGQATLAIASSTREDSGGYKCEAKNSIGSARSDAVSVLVLHSPLCDAEQKLQYGAAMGQQVSLVCRVEALPSALVFFGWSVNGSDWFISEGQRDPLDRTTARSTFNVTVTSEADYSDVKCKAYNGVNEMSQPCMFKVREPGPAERPNFCDIEEVTEKTAFVDCRDAYDGGFEASYWLQWRDASGAYVTAANLSSPDFKVSGLQKGEDYFMRVCASNNVYWTNVSCTADFLVSTKGIPSAGSVSGYSSDNNGVLIGGVVGAICFVCIVAVIIEIVILRKRDKKNMKEDLELYRRADPSTTPPVTEMHERNPKTPDAGARRSQVVTNVDDVPSVSAHVAFSPTQAGLDPVYDSADGLRRSLTPDQVHALTRQGEKARVVESDLPESLVDPEAEASRILHHMASMSGDTRSSHRANNDLSVEGKLGVDQSDANPSANGQATDVAQAGGDQPGISHGVVAQCDQRHSNAAPGDNIQSNDDQNSKA